MGITFWYTCIFMQAGFTLVESGFTKSSNAVNISMKNILDISVGTLSFWFIGYGLMYGVALMDLLSLR